VFGLSADLGGRRSTRIGWVAALFLLIGSGVVIPGASAETARSESVQSADPFAWLVPAEAPSGWKQVGLQPRVGVLWYPPSMKALAASPSSVSAAVIDKSGTYHAYLNSTLWTGADDLGGWAAARIGRQRQVAASVTKVAVSTARSFRGGQGACVIDDYVTRSKSHHYREIACLVKGPSAATVVVAAAPPADWVKMARVLERAVAAYQAR
jgi:hypothetical protein